MDALRAAGLAACALAALATAAGAGVVLAFDGTRCNSGAYQYWLTGNGMTGPYNQLIADNHTVQTTGLITPAALSGVDVFVTGRIASGTVLSPAEHAALQSWIAGGGALLYIGDNNNSATTNDQFGQMLGGPVHGGELTGTGLAMTIVLPGHPLVGGPGGVVSTIAGINVPGRWINPTAATTMVATNPDGSGAMFTLTFGAGRAVFVNDTNYFCYPPSYTSQHQALWTNVIAWLDGASSAAGYCFGDGSATACPCGNPGATGNGCASSVSPDGAHLSGGGSTSVAADGFVLSGSQMPNGTALYFQGTDAQNGGNGVVFGDGLRCVGGTIIRLGTKTNAAGASQYPAGGDLPVSVRGLVPAAGGVRRYQVWYRNAADFCMPSTFNLSNGVETTWTP